MTAIETNAVRITIDPHYANSVSKMSQKEYNRLKQNIKDEGLQYPLTVNQNYVLLDGHHRYKACQELGIPITEENIIIKEFDPVAEEHFVQSINLIRRHLNPFQEAEAIYELEKLEAEDAAKRQKAGKKIEIDNTLGSNENKVVKVKGKARDIAIEKYGASIKPPTYSRAKVLIETASEEVKQRLREGKSRINTELKVLKSQQAQQKIIEQNRNAPPIKLPEGVKLVCGDFQEACKEIPDNSIPLIFTDPPYPKEKLPLYEDLMKVAARVLIPGGSLVTYAWQSSIPQIWQYADAAGLELPWMICVHHNGSTKRYANGVEPCWKPLLWFMRKGEKRPAGRDGNIQDFIESEPPPKEFHIWAQSTKEVTRVAEKLTVEGDIILDPFMGSGTTGIAALELNRKFIGIENNDLFPNTFEVAKARIEKFLRDKDLQQKIFNTFIGEQSN